MRYLAIVFTLLIVGSQVRAEDSFDLSATGDHSVWVIVNDIRADFVSDTGITLDLIPELAIIGKGCQKGVVHAAAGSPDRQFGLVCCDLSAETVVDNDLKTYPFAKEPMAIVVNRANPVSGLTMDQVRGIFSGEITEWKEVGGPDGKIILLAQLHCPMHTPNWKLIFQDPARFKEKRVNIKTQPEMAKTVADFEGAIGHLEMTSVKEAKEDLKILTVDGYMPTSDNLSKGLYPLYGQLALITSGEASGNVLRFYDYLRTSPKVAKKMEKYGMAQME